MEIPTPRTSTRQRQVRLLIDSGKGGSNTLIDDARLRSDQAKESLNYIQVQDGLWKTRWGTGYYGSAITGESSLDGGTEYISSAGARELIVIGGTTGKVWKSTDNGSTWSEVTGATFTIGLKPFFHQISNRLYIANGTDALTYYDGSVLNRYAALSAPSISSITRTTLTAGSFNVYYQVTALNAVGETVGSTESTTTVNKARDSWASGEKLTIAWSAVTGATRYQLYYSDESGKETLLGDATTTSYDDDGSDTPNPYVLVPVDNTTAAPKFTSM